MITTEPIAKTRPKHVFLWLMVTWSVMILAFAVFGLLYWEAFLQHMPVQLAIYVVIWIVGLLVLRYSAKQVQGHQLQFSLSEERIEKSRVFFEAVMDDAPSLIYAHDLDGRFMFVNRAFELHFGVSHSELIGKTRAEGLVGIMPQEVAENNHQMDLKLIESGRILDFEEANVEPDGTHFYQTLKHPLRDSNGHVFGVAGISTEITDRKQMEDQIRQLAFNDALTKLPNRRLLDDRFSQTLAASERSKVYGALMFLDLDNFKPLNDLYGHDVGDLLLIQAADRLTASVRETDTVARIGGDEFVALISGLTTDKTESAAHASVIANKIRGALSEPYMLTARNEGRADTLVEHHCTVSIGAALFMGNEASQVDILRWADGAMYQAKNAGRNLIRFHEVPT